MKDPVGEALKRWGLEGAELEFVTGRENRVYRVHTGKGDYALRFRRPGYHGGDELESELKWLDAMDGAGISVPRPLASKSGGFLEQVDGRFVDVVGWLDGKPLGQNQVPLSLDDTPGTFRRLGVELARFHDFCDAWERPEGFTRWSWDSDGLLGEAPVWGRFWDNPTLDGESGALFEEFRGVARNKLETYAGELDYGLIHGDLARENVLLDGDAVRLIDLDDGGFGFRLFDIATVLVNMFHEPELGIIESALIEGYRTRRGLDESKLGLIVVLRAATYVGWIVPRIEEDGGAERNARFIARSLELTRKYLDQEA